MDEMANLVMTGKGDFVAATCHAVIHELFDRSPTGFSAADFFATIFSNYAIPSSLGIAPSPPPMLRKPYAYDLSGNMTNDGSNTMVFDGENRTASATGASSGTYTYDGNNLRVKKTSGSTTTVYIFAGSKVIAEYQNGAAVSAPTREYIYSGATLLTKIEAGATNYYHPDHLSPRVTTDPSGIKVGEQAHYPFGESWYSANTTTKWQFTCYERDNESGNDYAMARYNINRLGSCDRD